MKIQIKSKSSFILLCFVLVLLLEACAPPKKQYYVDLQNFVLKVEKEYTNYTDKDWEVTKVAFEKLSKERYAKIESDLTMEEKNNINEFFDRYEACEDKAVILEIKNGIKSGIKRASNFIENILKDTSIVN